ncbi:hypothetical protein EOM89_12265, partial [Candidatus Falkowbacteria bacterium]|nr:hypothetical protein [Candidatus Falkowbacteria bacterium]
KRSGSIRITDIKPDKLYEVRVQMLTPGKWIFNIEAGNGYAHTTKNYTIDVRSNIEALNITAFSHTKVPRLSLVAAAAAAARQAILLDVAKDMGDLVRVKGMVEKPKAEEAPSNLAVIGRYILTPQVMVNLNRQKAGAGGEIQLTDAIAEEIAAGNPVYGYRFKGQRYDCGSTAGFLQATVAFGLARDDLRDEFGCYLGDVMAMRKAAE